MAYFDLSGAAWRTSTHSGANGSCVEVAPLDAVIAVRDSKDRGGPALIFTAPQWHALTAAIRSGALPPG
jgi:Domain of unknown function (DUF397)